MWGGEGEGKVGKVGEEDVKEETGEGEGEREGD